VRLGVSRGFTAIGVQKSCPAAWREPGAAQDPLARLARRPAEVAGLRGSAPGPAGSLIREGAQVA
jgi:hypothetical protein